MNEKAKSKKMSVKVMDFTITPPKLKAKRGMGSLLLILRPLSCVLGPLFVPSIVYGVEGCTTLFWWILGISSLASLILLTVNTQRVDLVEYFKVNQDGGIQCLVKLGLLLLVCGGGTYAHHEHFYDVFSVCLFVSGVITGTFQADISAWWNFRRKKNLPYINFTKNSPTPLRPSFPDLRRKSFNLSGCLTNAPSLKRQLSSNPLNLSSVDEVRTQVPLSAKTQNVPMSPDSHGRPSSSSSSCESDGPEVPGQSPILTPTKKKVISAGLISLSPLANTPNTAPVPKRRLEFPRHANPSDISQLHTTPIAAYTECSVENLLSQNFSFFHM